MTYSVFLIIIMIVAFLLILIIMVQNPKGGGLSSSFGGGGTQALGGVQNTTNFLDRSTWTLSIVLLALILLSNFAVDKTTVDSNSELQNTLDGRDNIEVPVEQPATTTLPDSLQ
ncbi:MAG TPA: preprotein translocase subunit SecG [Flavobacteriaceae bacterium]|nr:preprotein translocase subunit SecG [Flavobacteriaceae bacterium]